MVPMAQREREIYNEMKNLKNNHFARLNFFQHAIAQGKPNDWKCRAGARYMYICEDGLVHYCSQQRGFPGKPLAEYTVADIRHHYAIEKSCAPYCTISCSHQTAYMDWWRNPQHADPELHSSPLKPHGRAEEDEPVQIQSD